MKTMNLPNLNGRRERRLSELQDRLAREHGTARTYAVEDAIHSAIYKLVAEGHLEITKTNPDWIAWQITPSVLAILAENDDQGPEDAA